MPAPGAPSRPHRRAAQRGWPGPHGWPRLALALLLIAPLGAALPPTPAGAAAVVLCPGAGPLDLNADGYPDTVVGDPYATVAGQAGAGAVIVLFGDADCRIGEGSRRVLTQRTAGVPGTAEAGDHFGWAVAVDDLDGDGRADLVVGSPDEDVAGAADAGSVHVISFAAAPAPGAAVTAQSYTETFLAGHAPRSGDQVGYTLATADDRGDDNGSIVAVGAPGTDVGTADSAGVVLQFGYTFGWGRRFPLQQGGTGPGWHLPGVPEEDDRFGASVLVAELNAPFTGDVPAGPQRSYVIGAPGDTVGGRVGAGSVTVAHTETYAVQQVTQDSPGVPGAAEAGDGFGASLAAYAPKVFAGAGAAARADRRTTADLRALADLRTLAVGAPGEDVGTVPDAGSVTVFSSELDGLHARSTLTQATAGVAGSPEPRDHFGAAVALRPAAAVRESVLAVAAPEEDLGTSADAGMVQLVDVTPAALTPTGSWSEDTAGTPGAVGPGHHFGSAVTALTGAGEDLLAVSSPYQGAGSVFVVPRSGVVRSWRPGAAGIPPASSTSRFGWSVAGVQSGG